MRLMDILGEVITEACVDMLCVCVCVCMCVCVCVCVCVFEWVHACVGENVCAVNSFVFFHF